MYEDFIWFLIILITSFIISNLLFRQDIGPFHTFVYVLAFIGVIFHEISHFLMCKLVNVPTDGIHIKYRYKGYANPHGRVSLKEYQRTTFLQMTLIALAPLFLSTWMIFWLLSALLMLTMDPILITLGFFICFSLLIGAAPSNTDFKHIPSAFRRDPLYSLYQLIIVLISGLIVWGISIIYPFASEFTIAYYFIIGIFYFILKYSLRAVNRYFIRAKSIVKSNDLNYKALTRKRIKPVKPYKIGREEAQW